VSSAVELWDNHVDSLRAEWTAIKTRVARVERAEIDAWEDQVVSMSAEMLKLRADGQWLGGSRTLLHALKLEHSELVLTAGLAWLLDPENFHRLGNGVLDALLDNLGLESAIRHPVRIDREEPRNSTRADLIVRLPGVTILVESKVAAGEQVDQCARLGAEWADESPVLVFLTRDRRAPETAGDRQGDWICRSWADVASIVKTAMASLPPGRRAAPGVLDYLETLHAFHGEKF
jgi:hypothetical protein